MKMAFMGNKTEMPDEAWGFWTEQFGKYLPEMECTIWHEGMADQDRFDFAFVWKPLHGTLGGLTGLKAIFSLGAGVDHIFSDPGLPKNVPVTRVIDPNLTQRMTEYVVMHVLMHHRHQQFYQTENAAGRWASGLVQPASSDRTVGILGLGELGLDSARALRNLGFNVRGWSQSHKQEPGVTSFAGAGERDDFLAGLDIVVCLLPLTESTRNILNADLFSKLPKGAYLINAARGPHLKEDDLIPALDRGQLSGACLDVFVTEPLPGDHPFWGDDRIMISPHNAADSNPGTISKLVVENIERLGRGEPMINLVDPDKGY